MKVFSLMKQWKSSNSKLDIRVGQQTYLTEISEQDVFAVAREETIHPKGTEYENFVPLDPYPSGELGMRLVNLKYLMSKVFEIALKYSRAKEQALQTNQAQSATQGLSNGSKKHFVSKTTSIGKTLSRHPLQQGSEQLAGVRALQDQRLAQHKIYKGPPRTLLKDDPENSRDAEYSLNRSSYLGFTRTQISKKTVSLDPVIGGRIPRPIPEMNSVSNKNSQPQVDYTLNKLMAQPNTLPSTMKQLFTEHHTRALQEKHMERQRLAEGIRAQLIEPKGPGK